MLVNEVSYPTLKAFALARSLSVQEYVEDSTYVLFAIDGQLSLKTRIPKSASDPSADQTDYEANLKPNANKPLPQAIAPFAAKTLANGKRLFARNVGLQFTLAAGANTLSYTVTNPWAKLIGAELINCEALDSINFKVFDNAQGSYSGVANYQLGQFAYTLNTPKDFYARVAPYDADIYQGMVLVIEYTSLSAKTIGVNLILNEVKT